MRCWVSVFSVCGRRISGARCCLHFVPEPGGDAVDRHVDAALDAGVLAALAVAVQQLDLDVVERVEIGEAVADRALEERIGVEQLVLAGDLEQRRDARLVFGADAPKIASRSFTSRTSPA